MSRRFQFSLRWLMVLIAAVCLVLGGLRLLKQSEFLELQLAKNVAVRGRFVRLIGPPDIRYSFDFRDLDDDSYGPGNVWSTTFAAKRSWFAIYDLVASFGQPDRPGRYEYTFVTSDGQRGPSAILSVK